MMKMMLGRGSVRAADAAGESTRQTKTAAQEASSLRRDERGAGKRLRMEMGDDARFRTKRMHKS